MISPPGILWRRPMITGPLAPAGFTGAVPAEAPGGAPFYMPDAIKGAA